ncbi:MAG: SigB/SigF/SigG family RNA polymerase sigma factor [Actinobacteria bacterium]|nr:SigB/SigF/SigG family RNA polymerase sigma factor [Actinomycetota bacterium]
MPERARSDRVLIERYQRGDRAARAEVIERFLPLARQLARRYARPDEPIEDLVQVASLGLLKALARYDPARGTAFSTFAVPTIVGELKRHFRDTAWAVHVPRGVQERIIQINRVLSELVRKLERSPSPAELAAVIDAPVEDVLEALDAAHGFDALSLDQPQGAEDESRSYAETVGGPDAAYEQVETAATLGPTIASMPPRDRLILRLRFEDDLTQSEIAVRCGISQMHVSRIISRSLMRLRPVAEAA